MKTILFAAIFAMTSHCFAAEMTGHWKGQMEIDGVPYLVHSEVIQVEEHTGFSVLLSRSQFGRNDLSFETMYDPGTDYIVYFYNVKDAGVGGKRANGSVHGYWLSGRVDVSAGVYKGTVHEIVCKFAPGGCSMEPASVGTFEFTKGSLIATTTLGNFEYPSVVDPAKVEKRPTLVVFYADGKVEVVGRPRSYTELELRLSGRVEAEDAVSLAGEILEKDAMGNLIIGVRIFEGKLEGKKVQGEIFPADHDPLSDCYLKSGTSLGRFSFQ